MVPPAVERRIGRTTVTLQYWIEDAINERSRRRQGLETNGSCPLNKDYALLELFDRLIYNTDRTQENILYRPDWRVALINHTRVFRTHGGALSIPNAGLWPCRALSRPTPTWPGLGLFPPRRLRSNVSGLGPEQAQTGIRQPFT